MTTTTAVSVQAPAVINGGEHQTHLTPALRALAQFYAAFNGRDLDAMSRNWGPSEEIAMDNPLGGIKCGWNEIGSVSERLFNGRRGCTSSFTTIRCTKRRRCSMPSAANGASSNSAPSASRSPSAPAASSACATDRGARFTITARSTPGAA